MFLGIDIGTSAVKALLLASDGQVEQTASAPLAVSRPRPLWSEQHADDWWQATCLAVTRLDPRRRRQVRAVGLTGQMHGATLLDCHDVPLRPAILWNDGRAGPESDLLQRNTPAFSERGGNLVMPGFTAPKLAWVRRHEPSVFKAIHKVLLPKDFIRLKLTGDYASDMSDAAGTLWMDVALRDWCDPLLAACGVTREQMPTLYEGTQITGSLRPSVAAALGLPPIPVCAGAGDNAAGAVGAGVLDGGGGMLSLGTSGVIFVPTEHFHANPSSALHAFCHAIPARWHVMAVMLSAASCLEWAARLTGCSDAKTLIALAERDADHASTPLFLPYLSGERTPHNDPRAQGVLLGLTHDCTGADIAQAVLEGVAFGLADGLQAIRQAGVDVDSLSVVGGGARSSYWGRILASALDLPLHYAEGAQVGPALGAARLAAVAVGEPTSTMWRKPPTAMEIVPEPTLVSRYEDRKARFQALYSAVQPHFEGASGG